MPTIGETAPDFELTAEDGKPVKLSDFRGKKVMLYFYPMDFTGGCELQSCSFRDIYPQIEAKNGVVLGIGGGDLDSHKKFHDELNLPFHLLYDKDYEVGKAWNSYGTKEYAGGQTFTGFQRTHYVIDENGRIIDIQNPVKAPESAKLALEKL